MMAPIPGGSLVGQSILHVLQARQNSDDTDGFYEYDPSKAAAELFVVLYFVAAVINIIQFFYYRAWFWWPMTLAILLEVLGYVFRVGSIHDTSKQGPFILQTVLLLVAPTVMAAACYQAFGRVVLWVTPKEYQSARFLWLPARRITPLFVTFDIISFFVQGIGGGVLAGASTSSKVNLGKDILLIGLGLQLACFGFFVIASMRFIVILKTKLRNVALPCDTHWPFFLATINVASALILIRTIFRLVEYVLGSRNYLSDHEAFTYCLDAAPIFIAVFSFICFHPGLYLPYIGIRRRELKFSRNVNRGIFANLARTNMRTSKPPTYEFSSYTPSMGDNFPLNRS